MKKTPLLSLVSSNESFDTPVSIAKQEKLDTLASHKNGLIRVSFLVVACMTANIVLVIYDQRMLSMLATLLIPYITISWALESQPKNNRVKLTFRRLFKTMLNYNYFIRLCKINNLHARRVDEKETRLLAALNAHRKSQIFIVK